MNRLLTSICTLHRAWSFSRARLCRFNNDISFWHLKTWLLCPLPASGTSTLKGSVCLMPSPGVRSCSRRIPFDSTWFDPTDDSHPSFMRDRFIWISLLRVLTIIHLVILDWRSILIVNWLSLIHYLCEAVLAHLGVDKVIFSRLKRGKLVLCVSIRNYYWALWSCY